VINVEKEGDYIRNRNEFKFIDGVLQAFPLFAERFGHIIIVTNQKGVGKGLMTEADLNDIHQYMEESVLALGGSVTKTYYCTAVDDEDPCRKPNPGMAFLACTDYPDIDLSRSVMIGNTMSDMQFGRSSGMFTIFIPSGKPMPILPDPMVDGVFQGLLSVAKAL
jgi:histidinol-phosphate phosphatase family protein